MLKVKIGICIDCPPTRGQVKIYAANRCQSHYWANRNKISVAKQKSRIILFDKNKKDNGELTLDEWFEYHVAHSNWICENCGIPLNKIFSDQVARSCQAHILPKAYYKSVMTDINNRMLLGGLHQDCLCHDIYDSTWENAQAMIIFPIALERFQLFKHKLSRDEIKRLPVPFKNLL